MTSLRLGRGSDGSFALSMRRKAGKLLSDKESGPKMLAPKSRPWTFLVMSLIAMAAVGQPLYSACPIEFQKVDPHAYPFTAGALGTDKDPWDHYLRIEYKNVSAKAIVAIRFGVAFVDALAEANRSVYSYDSSESVRPGKVAKPYWGDGVYFHQYGSKMGAIAWLEKVRFADNTSFADDGSHSCSLPPRAGKSSSEQTTSQPIIPPSANPAPEQVATNSEAARASPAAAAGLANVGHILNPQELADLVQKGQASKVAVVTVPPGAEVFVDGNKAGISPLVFVLLKQGDTPRVITIKSGGFKTVNKMVVPDGKTVPIGITLEKQ